MSLLPTFIFQNDFFSALGNGATQSLRLSQVTFPLNAIAVKFISFPLTRKQKPQELFMSILKKQISSD